MKNDHAGIAERAKNYLQNRPPDGNRKKRSRMHKFRILIWVIEAAVLLAVVEHFLVRPLLEYKPPSERNYDRGKPPAFTKKSPEEATGAEHLKNLRAVSPRRLPNLKYAADGSRAALQAQTSYARDNNLPVEVVDPLGIHFRLIPPGSFRMGSPPDEPGHNATESEHIVEIPYPFYMSIHEVTQAQWNAVMDNNPSYFTGSSRPVEEVSWYDCLRFLKKLCRRTDVKWGVYRLPTEQEWEYACRAGTATAFVCGDDPAQLHLYAAHAATGTLGTEPVGKRLPNAWGMFNMHGNVWEWCLTRYYGYSGEKVADEWQGARAIRGGNWQAEAAECRSANRARLGASSHGNILGFRIVRKIPADLVGDKAATPSTPRTPPPDIESLLSPQENNEDKSKQNQNRKGSE